MREHGRAKISQTKPSALGVCDRCGALYNLRDLVWQEQYVGPRLQNLGILVCKQGCLDKPQEQLRTIVLPPDPVPLKNARPENYVSDNNPLSALGANANPALWRYSTRIGNLTGGGGIQSAFDSNSNKPAWMSACNTISNSSYRNYVGINWAGDVSGITTPSSLAPPIITHVVTSFTATAPNDRSFLNNVATGYLVQGSPNAVSWTTIASGTTAGTNGEEVSGTCAGGSYQFHRFAIQGDQLNFVAIAQVTFNVGDEGTLL